MSDESTTVPPIEPLPDVPPAPYVQDDAPRADPYAQPAQQPQVAPAPPAPFGGARLASGAQPGHPVYGQPVYGQPAYGQQAPGQPVAPPPAYGYPAYAAPQPQGLSIASLVLGIAGVLGSFIYGIGLFPSIAALITGILGRKRQPHAKGMWLTGIITGSIGIGISIICIIGIIVFFVFVFSHHGDITTSNDFSGIDS
jgi:hypothetical protein